MRSGITAVLGSLALLARSGNAADMPPRLDVDLAPAYPPLGGAGVEVLARALEPHLSVGAVAAGHITFPTFISPLFWRIGGGERATLHWDLALGVAARYSFAIAGSGALVEAVAGYERWTVEIRGDSAHHQNALVVFAPGYIWYPLRSAPRFHLTGRLLVLGSITPSYTHQTGSATYGIRPLTLVPQLTVGASF